MKLKKAKKRVETQPDQQWSIIFKIECYGKMPLNAVDREDAARKFQSLPPQEMIQCCEVFKPQVMGILKKGR